QGKGTAAARRLGAVARHGPDQVTQREGIADFVADEEAQIRLHPTPYPVHRSASTRIAIAAIQDPVTRVAMPCHGRESADAAVPIAVSAAMPPHAVPISISIASRNKMASGGESNPRAAPDTSAT